MRVHLIGPDAGAGSRQLFATAADVSRRQNQRTRERALDREVPVLIARRLAVRVCVGQGAARAPPEIAELNPL